MLEYIYNVVSSKSKNIDQILIKEKNKQTNKKLYMETIDVFKIQSFRF
jgi:hypothetical protein